MKSLPLAFLAALLFLSTSAVLSAGDLKAPIDMQSAKVLPKGVRNIRYKGVLFRANDKFNNAGDQVVLADPLYKNVTWADMVNPKVESHKKGALKGYLELQNETHPNRYKMDAVVGRTTGAINVSGSAQVPVFAYGLGKKLTVAMAVPYVDYQIHVESGFMANTAELQKLFNDLKKDEKTFEQGEIASKLRDPVGTSLNDLGYQPLRNEEGKKLGDMKAIIKYQALVNDNFAVSLQNDYTLPTGEVANINKAVDVPTGDGQTDIGFGVITDWYPRPDLTVTGALNYTVQLKGTIAKRIPYREDSKASPDIDNQTEMNLGDTLNAQVGAKYAVAKGFNLNSSYDFLYKKRDEYFGTLYDPERYRWLGAGTIQNMQVMRLGLGYSTLPLFKEKKFPVPLELNLAQSLVIGGKNVTRDPVTSFEFVMYF